jgi:Cu/Ag efflux protein CusF
LSKVVSRSGRPLAAAAAGLVIVGLMVGMTLAKGEVRDVAGKVIAVELGSKTIVMEAPAGKSIMTVGAEVPDKASITAGRVAKKLSDIKVGDKIRMKYVREEDKLVVQSIAIQ